MNKTMFTHRSTKKEYMDHLTLKGDALYKNLDELALLNKLLGSASSLIDALNQIYNQHPLLFKNKNIIIGDLGCGKGDLLCAIQKWADKKNIYVTLIGIDANQTTIEYARTHSTSYPNILYKSISIFSPEFKQLEFDIVTINSFLHHLNTHEIESLFKQLSSQTHLAIIVNDLQRHWLSYFGFKCLSKLACFSPISQHDGSLSILRSFKKNELSSLIKHAHFDDYQIKWKWIFRWQIIIWLPLKDRT